MTTLDPRAIEDMAALLWRTEAEDVGAPASVAQGRTREAFDEQSDVVKDNWRKFARAALSQPQAAEPVAVGSLYGPFGWLNGCRGLSEDSWELESDPLENSDEYFAIPLYALVDPFKEIGPLYQRPSTTSEPVQVTDAMVDHMVQQFLRWKLPDDFNPDGGISFTKISNAGTSYEYRHEPVGTNLFDYRQAKTMVQHMLDGFAAIGAGGQAVAYEPCGGCGEKNPDKRCIGCLHPFSALSQPHPRAGSQGGAPCRLTI